MKRAGLAICLLLLGCFLPSSRADEALKNGDFSDGISHWSGDGEDVAQAAPDLAPKGLLVRLHSSSWTKVVQDFRRLNADFDFTVNYKLSDDCKFSDEEADYRKMPSHLGLGDTKNFRIPKGNWITMLHDSADTTDAGTYSPVEPARNADGTSTFQMKFLGLVPRVDKTIMLAFPPGQGSVLILNISMSSGTASVLADTTDFTLSGDGVLIGLLNNGETAFDGKNNILWQAIPATVAGQRFTKITSASQPHLTVHAKNNCTIQVISPTNLEDWQETGTQFSYIDDKQTQTPVIVYQKQLTAGQDLVIPETDKNVFLLIPN